MDNKLLLKEKDYELLATKRHLEFKHSFHDPLINVPKRRAKAKSKASPLFNDDETPTNSVLRRISKPMKINEKAIEEEIEKNETTPWKAILGFFQKAFDLSKESFHTQVANPFGSQGLKIQDQIKGTPKSSTQVPGQKSTERTTISIQSYIHILNSMKKDLKNKWSANDKVGSLQIAIQACKLLHDTSNAKFHALKFAHVMEIVQEFGINVFKRIKTLSFPQLKAERIAEIQILELQDANIPESAQEICRNWLIKISSIRELIPRTIIETTLLRLYFFLDNGIKAKKVLYRLAKTNRCFGQYINCIFFCTFLARIGSEALPQDKDYILDILDDVFFYIKQGKSKFGRDDISYDDFFVILEPFFISSFQRLSESLSKQKFKRFTKILPTNPHPIILKNFLQSFSPSLLVTYSIDVVKILHKLSQQVKNQVYKILFQRLSGMVFSQSGEFIMLAWNDLSQINAIEVLLDLLGPFLNIIFKNLAKYDKNRFLTLIMDKFNDMFDNIRILNKEVYKSFQNFITEVLDKAEDLSDLVTLEPFLQIITYFPANTKNQISMNITKAFLIREQGKINDQVVVHIVLSLMNNIEDDKVNSLALKFLQKVDYGNDLEQSLNFYCEMRAKFGHIEKVTVSLIYKAAGLTFKARKLSKGRVTNKLISFLQATISYCFITVPVLQSSHIKLSLYVYLSEVALSNNLISHATSLIKTCITQLAEAQSESDQQIYQIFFRIISFLIVMPDDPENQYLFLFNGLLQSFSLAKFTSNFEFILRFQFYCQCIVYLSCQAQQRLPFHIEGVTSNDALFKSIDFKKSIFEKLMNVALLMQQSLKKMEVISGGQQIDGYLIHHLCHSIMTLTSLFEETPRLAEIIKKTAKTISKSKERLFVKEQKAMHHAYNKVITATNRRLTQSQIQVQIK